ncbi:MAG: cytochrome P450 [Acidobacteria bacterium]|nr:cytochrome P450 [Acidobacteriota bacterium]
MAAESNRIELCRYADVAAALRDAAHEPGEAGGPVDVAAHLAFRAQARAAYAPERFAAWRGEWEREARALFDAGPRELIGEVAEPWARGVAHRVTGVAPSSAGLARALFEQPGSPAAAEATSALLPHCGGDALRLQAFTAMCHTLPAFLGNAWRALLEHQDELRRLPALLPGAMEELLRYAGPSTVQWRWRVTDGATVRLRLADANRDAEAFPEPDLLRLDRDASGHLAFGAGPHACVGGALIRVAAGVAVRAFAEWHAAATPPIAFTAEAVQFPQARAQRWLRVGSGSGE